MSLAVRRLALLTVLVAAGAWPAAAQAAVSVQSVGTFDRPIGVVSPPGDVSRVLVAERDGRVRLIKNGVEQSANFLDITSLVEAGIGEGGLLSIALAPDYASTGRFYAYYTAGGTGATSNCAASPTDGDPCPPIRIDEFRSSGRSADSASAGTRRPVMQISHPKYANHYGGQLQFDAAGRLYIGVGDGGSGGDPDDNAQNRASLLGKLLRIDPRQSGGASYTSPGDNPFVGVAGARPEVWAYGLRNPFRFSFDRQDGDLLVGDVGQNRLEEIDYHARTQGSGRGRNFGWNLCEGNLLYPINEAGCPLTGGDYVGPIHVYDSRPSPCRSVTGGYVVRDSSLEELYGRYVYSDYCHSQIRRLNVPTGTGDALIADRPDLNVVSFGEDACARLYVAEIEHGSRLSADRRQHGLQYRSPAATTAAGGGGRCGRRRPRLDLTPAGPAHREPPAPAAQPRRDRAGALQRTVLVPGGRPPEHQAREAQDHRAPAHRLAEGQPHGPPAPALHIPLGEGLAPCSSPKAPGERQGRGSRARPRGEPQSGQPAVPFGPLADGWG